MVNVCQTCGDRGYSEALVYCHKCQIHAVHRYCMELQKVTFEEDVIWFCEDCKPMKAENSKTVRATESADNSVCYVEPYLVNVVVAPIVRSIIHKHPDFSQDCPLSLGTISNLLQRLGMELKKVTSFTSENLKSEHLKLLDYAMRDEEFAKLNVNSLRHWHDQLKRAMHLLDLHQLRNKIKIDMANRKELPVSTKTTLNDIGKDIQLLKRKAASLEIEIQDQGGSMRDIALKCLSKIKRFCDRTLARGLL
ncbi:hypothetical protein SLE2022_240180 [Rubroshorea leprosula]